MKKYLKLFPNGFDETVPSRRAIENWPFVGHDVVSGEVVYTIVPKPATSPADNEIWFKANQPMTESDIAIAYTNANIIGLKYENDWYKIVYDGVVTHIVWGNLDTFGSLGINMTEIYLPNSVTSIGTGAFFYCTSLTSINIPDGVTSIGDSAFSECTSLTDIVIPESVTSIGEGAFSRCFSLTSIVIPDSVTSIGESAFTNCHSLTSVVIGSGVMTIEESTFFFCSHLTSVTIPNSVTSIGWSAFVDCSDLTSITIPNSVTSIGIYAFRNCSSLTSITFEGTQEQWNAVTKGTDWNTNVPATYVQCSDGQVTL